MYFGTLEDLIKLYCPNGFFLKKPTYLPPEFLEYVVFINSSFFFFLKEIKKARNALEKTVLKYSHCGLNVPHQTCSFSAELNECQKRWQQQHPRPLAVPWDPVLFTVQS